MGNYTNYSNISNTVIGNNNQINIQTNEISPEAWNLLKKELWESISKTENSQNKKYWNIYMHMLYKKIKLA